MSMLKQIKKITWWTIAHLPFHLRYVIIFRIYKGHWPRLFHPRDYSDYVFIDCFYGRHNQRAYLADKLEVRKYVESKGLENILVPLIGFWEDPSDIDFDKLPNQFVLKCNHSCGMNVVVYDKNTVNTDDICKQLKEWLQMKHPIFFERHYGYIKPMIICEALIPNNGDGFFPTDYKIHCAHGKPIYIQCCVERNNESSGKRVIYDCDWNKLPFVLNESHYTDDDIERPKYLDEMLRVASILSKDLNYARIDLYETDKGVLFGEITLTPMGGMLSYFTQEALDVMGQAIKSGERH